MGRVYTIDFTGTITAANAAVDLVSIHPAADIPVRMIGWEIGNRSEVGEAQEEGIRLRVLVLEATVTEGSGGAAGVNEPVDRNDAAASFSSRTMDTTEATTSTNTRVKDDKAWNLRGSPYEKTYPDPAMRPRAKTAQRLILRWETTVTDDVTVDGTVTVEEL